ncbi:hypothetical protein [Fluviicola taffensis]|uniref:Uncharacterized protein n=1 Tax=Fluviicola taffensis (strain DSM 16823 / NCIMB 13979 / RW262) TaxID=755732 RepID=F2I9P8_FLUTR|nr:hypothetical protein [Fluviicola taffensis]AEA43044.1 hypothetical protein Fluta_1046 [Fluviicola taffensis DSM 16823]
MNWKKSIIFSGVLILANSCMVEEAKPISHEKLIVYTDNYCPKDSIIIQEFEQLKHISVQVIFQSKNEIAQRIKKDKFNTGIDVLLLSSDSLREDLYNKSLFTAIQDRSIFKNINRQFHNNHGYWIPFSHNPLIMVTPRDSASKCEPMNWSKFKNDSIKPKLSITSNLSSYLLKLNKTEKFALVESSKFPTNKNYSIYPLDEFVEISDKDMRFSQKKCFYYLVEKQRYLTNFTSISLYKYSRNKILSEQFIRFFCRYQYQAASNRNQLSTYNTIQSNYLIRELEIQ